MPPKKKLPDSVIADFVKWIEMGAPDPRDQPPSATEAAEQSWNLVLGQRSTWWSLQPPAVVSPPKLDQNDWSEKPIDRFILSKLRERKLAPAADADALTLLRRLSFILTGLPPNPKLVHSFPERFTKNADQALAAIIDEFLESPHYGERMARHWMDVVRYTDTYGYEWDNPAKGSWEYRDYLIRAFNRDVGFDQMIREQIAGDLLKQPRIDSADGINESLIGPMFYHMGEHRHGDNEVINGVREEMIDNKIDAFSKAFLAMTMACARCHDHKFDAVSQRDYYALAGVFMTPRWTSRSIEAPEKNKTRIDELRKLRSEIHGELKSVWLQQAASFGEELTAAFIDETEGGSDRHRLWRTALGLSKKSQKPAAATKSFVAATGLDGIKILASRLTSSPTDAAVQTVWKQIAAEWRTANAARRASNAKQFKRLADFETAELPKGWITDGDGMRLGYVTDGTPLIALDGNTVVQDLLPRGYHTHALSSKLPGALRMPRQQDVPGKFVSVELAGGEWSGSIRMADNAFQTEAVKFLDWRQPRWTAFADMGLSNGIQSVSYDLVTSDLNPNFPPRTGVAQVAGKKLPNADIGFDKRSWFSVTEIVTHDQAGVPADDLARFASLFNDAPPSNRRLAAKRIGTWCATAVNNWANNKANTEDVKLLNWLISQSLLNNTASPDSSLAKLVNRYREVEKKLPFPRTVNSMDERNAVAIDYSLNVRGNINERGKRIPRGLLQVFSKHDQVRHSSRSGRLELAEFLTDDQHALTARVYVNRVWQWMFGSGLVRTPNDFGQLGDRPSHPRLLDYLTREFIADGWSTKQLIRRIVLSRSFRQSGRVSNRAATIDPNNRLLHHIPTRRLEAEAIRDSLLAVSGRLNARLYGRPINPHRHSEDPSKRLFSGPLDGNGRRSIYLQVSIMDPSKFLLSFNFPDPKLPTGHRDVTNVPTQALVLLNDPFVLSLAQQWADRLTKEDHQTPDARLQQMFVRALGRPPQKSELARWSALVRSWSTEKDDALMTDQTAWKHVAHTLFNTKEFTHCR
ncbi:MAG: DUF1553 domain-containing protein, partial [Planctomycetaceae bacterium]|nr:DUF1553 domain-containing protein [Planctomycetaceae bacterium]